MIFINCIAAAEALHLFHFQKYFQKKDRKNFSVLELINR